MAPKIKAIGALRPRIEQGTTVQKAELLRATGLVEGTFDVGLRELRDQILDPLRPSGTSPKSN